MSAAGPEPRPLGGWAKARLAELCLAAMLLTRLPMGRMEAPPEMVRSLWAYPLAGVLAALPALIVAGLAAPLGALPAALLAVGAGVLATGGLHEDGLADVADGFGGGRDRLRKLEIMRDSRVGSYGVIALVLGLGLRVSLLAELPPGWGLWGAFIGLAALSRAMMPLGLWLLPPARSDGLGASAGAGVRAGQVLGGLALAFALALLTLPAPISALIWILVVTCAILMISRRQIGGYTGDVLGTVQILTEIAGWAVLVAAC